MKRSTNPYRLYSDFLHKSTLPNEVLYTIKPRWECLGIPAQGRSYDDAVRFSNLIMFLSQIMAFEAFVARCLRDECGLTARQIREMRDMEVRIRCLLPGINREAGLRDQVKEVDWAFKLRNAWMHACNDADVIVRTATRKKRGKRRMPIDVFDDNAHDERKWVDGHIWSRTASPLNAIAKRIAERFGWPTGA